MHSSPQPPGAGRKKVTSFPVTSNQSAPQYPNLPADTLDRRSRDLSVAPAEADVLPLIHFALNASCTFLFEFKEGEKTPPQSANWHGDAKVAELLKNELGTLAFQSITGSKPASKFVRSGNTKYLIVGVPCLIEDRKLFLGGIIQNSSASLGSTYAAILQGYTTWFFYARTYSEKRSESALFSRVSALLELTGLCAAAGDVKEGTSLLVDHLREIVGCQMVALVTKKRGRFKLSAVSGGIEVDQGSEGGSTFEACIANAANRSETFIQDPGSTSAAQSVNGPARELARLFGSIGWLVSTLQSNQNEGKVIGGWVFLWNRPDPEFEEKRRFISAAATRTGPLLKLILTAKPDGFRALLLRVWKRLQNGQKQAATVFLITLLAAGLVPLPEKIGADCRLEPLTRRIIAAPFDGTLRDSSVAVGDRVKEGQLLAELDGREVRSRLVETIANRTRASKEADRAMETGKIAESQMAALEAESYSQQEMMLEERQDNLEVRAPIAGLVLQGDLERAEGAPLRMGDQLFEIAPIQKLLVEIELPSNQLQLAETGMPIRFKVDSYSHKTFEATLLKIPPQSEIRNGINVFVCEAEIDNPDEHLRPGMEGSGKISGKRTPVLWSILRPAVNWLRLKLWI